MGKKRIIQKADLTTEEGRAAAIKTTSSKKKFAAGVVHVQATYNNTIMAITDLNGDVIVSSSAGSLGFSGAKKGTPFAAAKVGELLGDKANIIGLKEVDVVIRGVGAGRESALRGFAGKGIEISRIADETPVPHNGPRPPKPRRV